MASQDHSYRAGEESKGQGEEKMKDQLPSSFSPEMEQSSAPAAGKKDGGGGLMQRTGEQVKSMAQGAAEKVKQSFGMAEEEEDDDEATAAGGAAGAGGRTTTRRTNY